MGDGYSRRVREAFSYISGRSDEAYPDDLCLLIAAATGDIVEAIREGGGGKSNKSAAQDQVTALSRKLDQSRVEVAELRNAILIFDPEYRFKEELCEEPT